MHAELSLALSVVARMPILPRFVVAGRTDAGVHARGQVCHVDLPALAWAGMADNPVGRLNGLLPRDIRVNRAAIAADGFDARFSAQWRRYAYRVIDSAENLDPLMRNYVVTVSGPLDLVAMNEAGQALLGLKDFSAFCRRRDGATTVRDLRELHWFRNGPIVELRILADAFCHGMVRSIVGSLLPVGAGRRDISWPAELAAASVRDPMVNAADPAGLVLEEVGYPSDEEFGIQADATRRRRH